MIDNNLQIWDSDWRDAKLCSKFRHNAYGNTFYHDQNFILSFAVIGKLLNLHLPL
jgi:hypothetical protein